MANVNINIRVITEAAQQSIAKLDARIKRLEKSVKKSKDQVKGLKQTIKELSKVKPPKFFGNFGGVAAGVLKANIAFKAMAIAVAGVKDITIGSVQAFREYEVAMAKVAKTTNSSVEETAALGRTFQEMSTKIPVATEELARLAQIGAQLGIRGSKNLATFADTAARLARTVEGISGEDAALQLAKLLKLTKRSTDDIDNLGSALTEVGNKFAVVEGEVLTSALEIGKAGTAFGISAEQAIAFATAFKESGVQSELAGSTISRVLSQMANAINTGGSNLKTFAKISGETTEQFKKNFDENATKSIQNFLGGLNRVLGTGGIRDVKKELNAAGLASVRNDKSLLPLISNYENFAQILQVTTKASEDNTALYDESNKLFDTMDGNLQALSNSYNLLKTNIGELVSGPIKELISKGRTVTTVLAQMFKPGEQQLKNELTQTKAEINSLESQIRILNKRMLENQANGRDSELMYFNLTKKIAGMATKAQGLTARAHELRVALGYVNEEVDKAQDKKLLPGSEAEVEEKLTLLDLFRNQQLEKQAEFDAQVEAQIMLASNTEFEFLKTHLGEMEAARIAARANDLVAKGEYDKASLLLTKSRHSAEKKMADEARRQQLENDRTIERDRKSLANNLVTIGKLAGGDLFKVNQALALGIATVDGFTAIQKAATIAPFPANLPSIIAETARVGTTIAGIKGASPSFEQGGIVPGSSFTGDNVSANVNSGEMILNRQQQSQLFNIANGAQDRASGGDTTVVVELDGEVVAKAVSRKVADGMVLGENV